MIVDHVQVLSMSDGLLFSDASTHDYIASNCGYKLFGEPFSEQLISYLKLDQSTSTSPFMDMIGYVHFNVLLKRCEKIGACFIMNRQLKMHEKGHC